MGITELIDLSQAGLAKYDGIKLEREDGLTLLVTLPDDEFTVSIDDFDEDEDDPIGDDAMSEGYGRPVEITDHVTLLDAILASVAGFGHRRLIKGLTTDGDGRGCEAVFAYDGNPTILKVR